MNQEQIQAEFAKYKAIVRKHLVAGQKMDVFEYYLKTKFNFMFKDVQEIIKGTYTKGNKLLFTSETNTSLALENGKIPELKIAYFDAMCAKAAELGHELIYVLTEKVDEKGELQIELQWVTA